MSVKIRKVLFNAPEAKPEDYSLIPRITESEGYETLPEIIAKCTAGIELNARVKSSKEIVSDALNDYAIEDIHSELESMIEAQSSSEAGTNEAPASENSSDGEPKAPIKEEGKE